MALGFKSGGQERRAVLCLLSALGSQPGTSGVPARGCRWGWGSEFARRVAHRPELGARQNRILRKSRIMPGPRLFRLGHSAAAPMPALPPSAPPAGVGPRPCTRTLSARTLRVRNRTLSAPPVSPVSAHLPAPRPPAEPPCWPPCSTAGREGQAPRACSRSCARKKRQSRRVRRRSCCSRSRRTHPQRPIWPRSQRRAGSALRSGEHPFGEVRLSNSQRRKGEAARITLKLPVTHCHLPRLPQAPEEYTQKKPNAAFSTLPIQMCGWRR